MFYLQSTANNIYLTLSINNALSTRHFSYRNIRKSLSFFQSGLIGILDLGLPTYDLNLVPGTKLNMESGKYLTFAAKRLASS